ncbi:DUF1127 domain-containing protein [Pseudomonas sp. Z8(2022)]|jgi:uncharacterized protein YjiS (DUF1127 family)|uniref:DUF1127 domain-containing protein n=1 Tax=Pseudomonas sp. Z8(2022) TaxID=2962597 RepID=UPI0021F4AA85|nr:DUF1127 domain-containing protein [Pseudomonas sp. Z8(2022)]UYP30289.1 DUF1127 domain-containing protein [Pseudomonas sp. Z8(2022)]
MSGCSKTDFAALGEWAEAAPHEGEARYFGRNWPAFWRRLSTRRALRKLGDQQLRDIGLNRAQAEREANLPFWKL